jgi:hypothetical protein
MPFRALRDEPPTRPGNGPTIQQARAEDVLCRDMCPRTQTRRMGHPVSIPAPSRSYGRYRPNISRVPRRTTAGSRTDNSARGFVRGIAVDRSTVATTPQATSAMVMMTERTVRASPLITDLHPIYLGTVW